MNNMWGEQGRLSAEQEEWRMGDLTLRCRMHNDDLWFNPVYVFSQDEADSFSTVRPVVRDEDLVWKRWSLQGADQQMSLWPMLPDLPVVIKPESLMILMPGTRVRIYVRCPLWARMDLSGPAGNVTVGEFPTILLSNTWFGAMTEGELCYWLASSARRKHQPDPTRKFLALCPINIVNRSHEEMAVEKICLRVEGLTLYEHEGQVWSSSTDIAYLGSHENSRIRFKDTPPREIPSAKFLAVPRVPGGHANFFAKSFQTLRNYTVPTLFS